MSKLPTSRVFLRSGLTFDVVAAKASTTRDRETNELTGLAWEDIRTGRPLYIRPDAVDAVVEL
ncbi:hypothetical protein AB0D97_14115 [Streptomyces roseus]|uniref:hypothetical protein n=1 Tax=Streptomyces roseus TaxID=66430 RepID=UPI0034013D6F